MRNNLNLGDYIAIKCQFLSLLPWKWPEHCKEMQHNELMLAQQGGHIPLIKEISVVETFSVLSRGDLPDESDVDL